MKIRTKLKIGQILFEVHNCRIIKREVVEVRTYADKEIHQIKYVMRDTEKNLGRETIEEKKLKEELFFTRKDDAKMYLYNLIAAM